MFPVSSSCLPWLVPCYVFLSTTITNYTFELYLRDCVTDT